MATTPSDSGAPIGARRVVSLVPSITETLFALGLGDRVVGVTDYCRRPEAMPSRVVRIGGTKTPDLALIRRLWPDRVFANIEENRAADIDALRRWTTVDVAVVCSVRSARDDILLLGTTLGADEAAGRIARRVNYQLRRLTTAFRRYRFAYLVWRRPWMAAGPNTYIGDLLAQGGGENVFAAAADRYPKFVLPQLAALAPDVVFLPDEPYQFNAKHAAQITAVMGASWTGACHFVAGDNYSWHGVRMVEGLAEYRAWLTRTYGGARP